ncbi:DoxX family protein [Trinickia caryophylli]|uniref:Putative oxidoreductase n=1 Tax=Trinickia caryophylli TaxID=28094 RepID=A0A1X7DD38_TRICW|nr:DoxX family protein [Trinickia caryophylli]WQE12447.1 DoxX family protein [Trinickia caryophylli]SMF13238.1 putative oxidoreductase [Trinickia caryophylli]
MKRNPFTASTRDSETRQRLLFPFMVNVYEAAEPFLYAALRCGFGLIVFTHGLPKLLGTSHGSMADPMQGSIDLIRNAMGLPFAPELAFLVMLLETFGALFLAAGLVVRPVALAIMLEMVGISYALGPRWPWIDRGIEYPVLMALLAAYIAVRGGGTYALDKLAKREF